MLWIGYLQWHLRTRGDLHTCPSRSSRTSTTSRCRDAVLAYDAQRPSSAMPRASGNALGRPHHQAAPGYRRGSARPRRRVPVLHLQQPAPGQVARCRLHRGQPAVHRQRHECAMLWATAIRKRCAACTTTCLIRADFVMYWWDKAAELARTGKTQALRLHHHEQLATNAESQGVATPHRFKEADLFGFRYPRSSVG